MFGLWIWVPPERGQRAVKTAERMVLHTHLYSVQVARGPRTPAAVFRRRAAAAARKLEKAKLLLQKGDLAYQVSEALGFENYSYFSKVFKKYIGITPDAFRRQFLSQRDK